MYPKIPKLIRRIAEAFAEITITSGPTTLSTMRTSYWRLPRRFTAPVSCACSAYAERKIPFVSRLCSSWTRELMVQKKCAAAKSL